MISLFEGRVTVTFAPYNLKAEIEAQRLEAAIKPLAQPYLETSPGLSDIIEEFTVFLAVSRFEFTFKGDEKAPLIEFRRLIENWRAMPPIDIWEARLTLHAAIMRAWRKAYTEARAEDELWASPAELPTAMLTAAQKAEAAIPGSPLA